MAVARELFRIVAMLPLFAPPRWCKALAFHLRVRPTTGSSHASPDINVHIHGRQRGSVVAEVFYCFPHARS